jgi:hypothetical protein
MFEVLDGQFGKAVYTLTRPAAECLEQLGKVPEIADDALAETERQEGFTGARVWFAGPGDPEKRQVGAGTVMGRILLGPTHWRLEAIGADRPDSGNASSNCWASVSRSRSRGGTTWARVCGCKSRSSIPRSCRQRYCGSRPGWRCARSPGCGGRFAKSRTSSIGVIADAGPARMRRREGSCC